MLALSGYVGHVLADARTDTKVLTDTNV